jgi:hypothetical protein
MNNERGSTRFNADLAYPYGGGASRTRHHYMSYGSRVHAPQPPGAPDTDTRAYVHPLFVAAHTETQFLFPHIRHRHVAHHVRLPTHTRTHARWLSYAAAPHASAAQHRPCRHGAAIQPSPSPQAQSFHLARTRGKRSRVEKALPLLVQCRLRMADCMDWTLSGGSLEEAPKTEPVVWLLKV